MIPQSVVTSIDKTLRTHGFHVKKAIWNRKSRAFVDVVSLQMDNSLDEFAVNVGVLYPAAFIQCFGKKPPVMVDDIHCTAGWRLRAGEPTVEWWTLDDAQAPTVIARAIEEQSLPSIESLHSLDALERYLGENQRTRGSYAPESIYLATLLADLGRIQEAKSVLTESLPRHQVRGVLESPRSKADWEFEQG
jgi:Domain of unknown function (DUF4304)